MQHATPAGLDSTKPSLAYSLNPMSALDQTYYNTRTLFSMIARGNLLGAKFVVAGLVRGLCTFFTTSFIPFFASFFITLCFI